MSSQNLKQDTLYYDGSCQLCRGEIFKLKEMADENICFVDIHGSTLNEKEKEARLKILHLETASGEQLEGLDANVAAWQHTSFGFLLRPLRWSMIAWFADKAYFYWAERRFQKLYPKGFGENLNHATKCRTRTADET